MNTKLLKTITALFAFFSSALLSAQVIASNHSEAPEAEQASHSSATQSMPHKRYALGFDVGFTSGPNANPKLTYQGNNQFNGGDQIDMDFFSAGVDFRYFFGPIPFLTNNIKPTAYCGAWARHAIGDTHERGLNLDLHPTAGNDVFLGIDREGFFMPYCGLNFMTIQQMIGLSLFVGARFEFMHIEGIADESGGGGVRNTFRDHDTGIAPTIGLEAEMPMQIGNNLAAATALYFLFAVDYLPGVSVAGTSETNNFTYNFETDGEWGSRVVAGIRLIY